MPVPDEIRKEKQHAIYVYCKSLNVNAEEVAQALGQDEYFQFWVQSDLNSAAKNQNKVVWLIGHGLHNQMAMLDEKGKEIISMKEIVSWCNAYGTMRCTVNSGHSCLKPPAAAC